MSADKKDHPDERPGVLVVDGAASGRGCLANETRREEGARQGARKFLPDNLTLQWAGATLKLGDLSGAMREVTWWRTSFGADAADDLLEEVERTARVSLH